MGRDGFDYPFQAVYLWLWATCAEWLRRVAAHNPQIDISLGYKPNEPRAFSLLPDAAATLLMLAEVAPRTPASPSTAPKFLYADEIPAFAASLIVRRSRHWDVHLDDS